MLHVPLPVAVPVSGPATYPLNAARMSKPEETTPSLLWVNKDATNLHSKKHVAEVNAHVQKRGSRTHGSRRSVQKSSTSSSRDSKYRRRKSESPVVNSIAASSGQTMSSGQHEILLELTPSPRDKLNSPLYQSLTQGTTSPSEVLSYHGDSLGVISQLAHAEDHLSQRVPGFFELSAILPDHLSHLSGHDQMLVRTYLSYVPHHLYGPLDATVYCPVRYASITDMGHDQLELSWILITIDMFLAKARGDLEHTALILQRKDEAYRLMADRLNDPHDAQSLGFITATASAAAAELFFGDSSSALMHLGAIDAVLQSQGGHAAVSRLPLSISIPLLTAFAYRSLLQDNLLAASTFDMARVHFKDSFRSMLVQDQRIRYSARRGSNGLFLPLDETSVPGMLDPNNEMSFLQDSKHRAFSSGAVLRRFIEPDFTCTKPSDSVDHFLFLYNINIALHDFASRGEYGIAVRFLEDLMQDVLSAEASGGVGSTLKMSGARCLFIARHAKSFGTGTSEGVARAWQAVDALEILKYLSPSSRSTIYQTLSAILMMDESKIMTLEMLEAIDMECATTWWTTAGLHELSSI